MSDTSKWQFPVFTKPIIVIVGGFGSGKTEISVNLALYFASIGEKPVSIADLDLVNPYFRSREAISEMDKLGIRTVSPKGGHAYADLPILLPEVKGLIENCKGRGRSIIDVGGDSQGTKALGSLAESFNPDSYDMLMVINSRRPQSDSIDTCLNTISRIESVARLKFTGLISNSHLIDETTPEILKEGLLLSQEVGRNLGLSVKFLSAREDDLEKTDLNNFDCAVLPLNRLMLKPWETS